MDRIMPIDLERVQLRKRFRGYETSAVDKLLKGAADSLQNSLIENVALREEVERQRQELDRTRAQEDTLKDALLLAQKAADETRAAAQRHAESIMEEARQAASTERHSLQRQTDDLRWDLERLRTERERFEADFRSMLDRYQRDLSVIPLLNVIEGGARPVEA